MGKQKFVAGTAYELRKRFDFPANIEELPQYPGLGHAVEIAIAKMDEDGYDLYQTANDVLVFRLRGAPSAEAAKRAKEQS